MEILGVVGQLTVAEVFASVTSLAHEVDSLPPLPRSDDQRRVFDKKGYLPFEALLKNHLLEYPGHTMTLDEARELTARLKPYNVTQRELVQLLAHRPHSRCESIVSFFFVLFCLG